MIIMFGRLTAPKVNYWKNLDFQEQYKIRDKKAHIESKIMVFDKNMKFIGKGRD